MRESMKYMAMSVAMMSMMVGCATLGKQAIDQDVVKSYVCSSRVGEAKEYILGLRYRLPQANERIERAKLECPIGSGLSAR